MVGRRGWKPFAGTIAIMPAKARRVRLSPFATRRCSSFFLLAMGLFWAGQGADLIRRPAESFMVNARQWIYYGGGTAVIGLVLILLARR